MGVFNAAMVARASSTFGTAADVEAAYAIEDYRPNSTTDCDSDGINSHAIGYSSAHTGGLNIALVDGSARFIDDFIVDEVFLNLLQRNDGNIIDLTGL